MLSFKRLHVQLYSTNQDVSVPGPSFRISDSTWCHWTPVCHILLLNLVILQGSFRLCNWLSLRRLVSWINHLPSARWSTFWESILKHQLVCRFGILDSISSLFCILTYAIIYVLIHHIMFWLYLYFLNILYFFKYSCTNIFHRRSLFTFYFYCNLKHKMNCVQILTIALFWLNCLCLQTILADMNPNEMSNNVCMGRQVPAALYD